MKKSTTDEQLRKDALLLFKAINDEYLPEDVKWKVIEYVQDIYTQVPETW
jgi:hypothetical protein